MWTKWIKLIISALAALFAAACMWYTVCKIIDASKAFPFLQPFYNWFHSNTPLRTEHIALIPGIGYLLFYAWSKLKALSGARECTRFPHEKGLCFPICAALKTGKIGGSELETQRNIGEYIIKEGDLKFYSLVQDIVGRTNGLVSMTLPRNPYLQILHENEEYRLFCLAINAVRRSRHIGRERPRKLILMSENTLDEFCRYFAWDFIFHGSQIMHDYIFHHFGFPSKKSRSIFRNWKFRRVNLQWVVTGDLPQEYLLVTDEISILYDKKQGEICVDFHTQRDRFVNAESLFSADPHGTKSFFNTEVLSHNKFLTYCSEYDLVKGANGNGATMPLKTMEAFLKATQDIETRRGQNVEQWGEAVADRLGTAKQLWMRDLQRVIKKW